MGSSMFSLVMLLFSATTITRGSEVSDTCFNSCIKLLDETKTGDDNFCSKKTETSYQDENSCRLNCRDVSSKFGNDTGFPVTDHDFVSATSSPSLYMRGYDYITIRWNTSAEMSKNVAFYILQVELNTQSLQSPLELPPSIPRYVIVRGENFTSSQTYTVDNLVNGFQYQFRVGAVGLNKTSSQFSAWSSWYATSGDCNRTNGIVITGFFIQRKQQKVLFPCSVSRVTLHVSIKASNKNPVVLDANLTWKNPPGINEPEKVVEVTVKLLKHEDKSIDERCAHYHDTDFKEQFPTQQEVNSWHLPASGTPLFPKSSIHFGCSYSVNFKIIGAQGENSFESTTTFTIPECLQNVTSCPVPNPRSDTTSSVISEKILYDGNTNSSYAANISWNAEGWMKSHKIEFFHVVIQDISDKKKGDFYYTNDIPAKDGVVLYHTVSKNMSEGQDYRVLIYAYHGVNCIHDILEKKVFRILRPCGDGCTENATCWPPDTFDGTAKCKCKVGFSGNGTLCRETEAQKPCGNVCSENATCLSVDESDETAGCKCNAGFSGDGISCTETEAQKPCGNNCSENATCLSDVESDGTARCKCNVGFSGDGISCTATEPEPIQGDEENKTNVLAIVLPLAFVIAFAGLVFAFITWRIKKKKELVLSTIEAHESAISPSSSNINLYQHYPPRYNEKGEVSTKENEVVELDEKEVNLIYVPQEIQDAITHGLTDGYEFNAEQIKFEECLGRGAFGYVHRARALGITAEPEWTLVAVKTLNEPVTDKSVEDFIAEIELMKKLDVHEDIIEMLGCCTLTLPICLIMEYAPHGNLLTYLRAMKAKLTGNDSPKKSPVPKKLDHTDNPAFHKENLPVEEGFTNKTSSPEESSLTEIETDSKSQMEILIETNAHLEPFALQIARGMAYVAGRGIVHRDLAARNILIGKDYKLKISDFGLSKEGVYVKSTSGKIPLRWLSIEAIRERIYSSASDVWSYGIVLWEICTLGDFPYPTLSDRQLLKYLLTGERLEKPNNCADKMYQMMLDCWQALPEDRPTFAHLRDVLWRMHTGENPYINIDPMSENLETAGEPENDVDANAMEV